MNIDPIINIYNQNCMEAMKDMQDNQFDLAIVDPNYGIGKDWEKRNNNNFFKKTTYKNERVSAEYFIQLKRISKNQIIWGWNYYTEYLGSTNYLIIWDKQSNNNLVFNYSKCEIAYVSKKIPCNLVSIPWDGYRMGKETGIKKIHPHQKPIELYKWLLNNYAKKGDKIIDTHAGSCSLAVACWDLGYDLEAYEIDKIHYKDACDRLEKYKQQLLFRI